MIVRNQAEVWARLGIAPKLDLLRQLRERTAARAGAYVAHHKDVDEIHITGSARTHDAVRFGSGPEGEQRKRDNRPLSSKRMTSELGNVSPTIVVPGPWNDADVRFQAEHIPTQKMHNGGFTASPPRSWSCPRGGTRGRG
jgi:aldehyde dehydrogenase (NAD(P)+)